MVRRRFSGRPARIPQRVSARWPRRWAVTCLAWLALALMAGCSASPGPPKPLPELHLPGVTRVHGIFDGQDATYIPDRIVGLSTYQPAGLPASAARILIGPPVIYEMGLDGSRPHRLSLHEDCDLEGLAVTPDGQRALCATSKGIKLFSPMAQPEDAGRIILPNQPTGQPLIYPNYRFPVWRPDGSHFAVITNVPGQCSIAIFSADASGATFRPTAFLALPTSMSPASTSPACRAVDLTWSPDGEWLTFFQATTTSVSPNKLYALRLSALSPYGHEAAPVTIPIESRALVHLGARVEDVAAAQPVWVPGATTALTLITADLRGVVRFDLATSVQTTVLHLGPGRADDGRICAVAWAPDGRALVFAYCRPGYGEFVGPPAQVYAFTSS